MHDLTNWIEAEVNHISSNEIIEICFNLYEDGNDEWSLEIVGTNSFDMRDADWACAEVYTTREHPYRWHQITTWDKVLQEVREELIAYLQCDTKQAKKLVSYQGIGLGFVDGDMQILYHS